MGGGVPCAPACNPHYGPGTQCQQSPGAEGTEHPPGHELVPPALHSGTCWVMVAHGIGLARPQHCVQLPAGSPCPPPCLAPGKTLLTCASADLLLWWREGATRGMWPWKLQAISEAREAKPASERESGGGRGQPGSLLPSVLHRCPAPGQGYSRPWGGPAPAPLAWTADHLEPKEATQPKPSRLVAPAHLPTVPTPVLVLRWTEGTPRGGIRKRPDRCGSAGAPSPSGEWGWGCLEVDAEAPEARVLDRPSTRAPYPAFLPPSPPAAGPAEASLLGNPSPAGCSKPRGHLGGAAPPHAHLTQAHSQSHGVSALPGCSVSDTQVCGAHEGPNCPSSPALNSRVRTLS